MAWQATISVGGGFPGVGMGMSSTFSEAPTYKDMEKGSVTLGGSFSPGFSFGFDQIFSDYLSTSYSGGIGLNLPFTVFLEGHGEVGYTWTIVHYNLFDIFEGLKFKNINGCP